VATISANGINLLNGPLGLAFDGERITAANYASGSVSLFKAADLSFIANVPVGNTPFSACSDGINFWIPLYNAGTLVRF
jgi:YVTN family beta-propeller protein